jgi:Uma2 family endonuclease
MDPALLAPEKVRPLRRAEYDRLVELGVFGDERVELLYGFLVAMSPHGALHAGITARLHALLVLGLGDRAEVRSHSPLAVSGDSEPEPDLAIVPQGSLRSHPDAAHLVVEVAASSLQKDRVVKARLYGEAGIPEYWIVNLEARTVEVRRDPRAGQYASLATFGTGDTIAPQAFPDVKVALAELLPEG